MSKLTKALTAAAGNAGGDKLYVEDVFSTYLYTGNSSTQTITNDIDLDGEGGLVWIKNREGANDHSLFDTERGATKVVYSNKTDSQETNSDTLTSFNSNGFSIGADALVNTNNNDQTSWTFRKAEKFFDVVTYTGNGVAGRNIAHNLGSVPGMVIVKSTNANVNWEVYHKSLGNTHEIRLNQTTAALDDVTKWNDTTPTDSVFTVGTDNNVNRDGWTYVAYLFASDAGGFGDNGSENIIKCGSFTTDGSGEATVNLGFEPQWFLIKRTNGADPWYLFDSMRGFTTSTNAGLQPNSSDAEFSLSGFGYPTATGWSNVGDSGNLFSNANHIYIAIRRPMKTPESGTEVFNPFIYTGNNVGGRALGSLSGADAILAGSRNTADSIYPNWQSKLQGNSTRLVTSNNGTEYTSASYCYSFGNIQDGVTVSGSDMNGSGKTYVAYEFKRATGFFDVVAYTGTGSATTVSHNLGVVPELMIVKVRDNAGGWQVYSSALGATKYLVLNENYAEGTSSNQWNNTSPTSSVFTVGHYDTNESSRAYIAYLFATLAGVSKVGSYTGNGTSQTIDCGFSNGARFVLLKNTSISDNWYVFDTARGIVSGADPYLRLNFGLVEQSQDFIDPDSSGFAVSGNDPANNRNGSTYIFLAIA